MVYRSSNASLPSRDVEWISGWKNLTWAVGCGWSVREWVMHLRVFIDQHRHLLAATPDDRSAVRGAAGQSEGGVQFPPNVHCYVFDNLNGAAIGKAKADFSFEEYRADLLSKFVA